MCFVPSSWLFVFFVFVRPVVVQAPPTRIVSLVPALTEMLFAIGAGPQVVAVSSYDQDPPEVRRCRGRGAARPGCGAHPRACGRPRAAYGSQTDLREQMRARGDRRIRLPPRRAGRHHTTIRALGARTGHADAEDHRASDRVAHAAVRARVSGRGRPRTLLVFGRERGRASQHLRQRRRRVPHDALEAAGGANVFADVDRESVQATTELILARAPEVIVELRSSDDLSEAERAGEIAAWSRLSSVPAVRDGRIHVLTGRGLTVPGPRIPETVEQLAKALHPAKTP
jgi:iron complex transport system substrate-binding protein